MENKYSNIKISNRKYSKIEQKKRSNNLEKIDDELGKEKNDIKKINHTFEQKSIDYEKYVTYIDANINNLKQSHKIEILQMIMYSDIDDEKIFEKGNGTGVHFTYLNDALLENIYNFIYTKIENMEDLF